MMTETSTYQSRYAIDQKIMDILDEDAANEEYLLDRIHEANQSVFLTHHVYSALLRVFTSMEFPEEEAETIWQAILDYKKTLSKKLNRDVGFRVAMLDYFINVNKKLINPKLIEIRLFAETEKLVLIDELTKLYNRRHFQNSLQREFKQAKRYNHSLSLLIIDIDNFKKINDTYGHPKGDEILISVAKSIDSNMRIEDTACRIGGEEFAILLPQTSEPNAMIAAQKLLENIRKIEFENQFVTVSGGVVSYPEKANSADQLFDFADRALYFAKFSGKNRIVPYSHDKRSSMRYEANFELSCQLPDKSFKSMSKNISITGIAFETSETIELDDLINVRLHDDLTGNQIDAKIRIVRKEETDTDNFHIGAEFIELGANCEELIKGISKRKDLIKK